MARGKTRYIRNAKSRRTRLCFLRENIKLVPKTPSKDSNEGVKECQVELYPNYPIVQDKVQLGSRKPNNYVFKEDTLGLELRFHSNCSFAEKKLSTKVVESCSHHVVQVHSFSFAEEKPQLLSGTGLLIQNSNKFQILTCLHLFSNSLDQSKYLIVFTRSNTDRWSHFDDLRKSYYRSFIGKGSNSEDNREEPEEEQQFEVEEESKEAEEVSKEAEDPEPKPEPVDSTPIRDPIKPADFLEYIRKNTKSDVFQVDYDHEFLQFRKKWLEEIRQNERYAEIKDPDSGMKPSPAFDISLLNIGDENIKSLQKGKKKFMNMTSQNFKDIQAKENDNLFLIGFNETDSLVNFGDQEYMKTIAVEQESEASNSKGEIQVKIDNFLHDGASVSCGKYLKMENGFLLYKACSSSGSSGGPVFDEKGRLLGINFGNFQDIEEPDPVLKDNGDPVIFDISDPNEILTAGSRNYNLAIAVNHNGLLQYLERRESQVIFSFTICHCHL